MFNKLIALFCCLPLLFCSGCLLEDTDHTLFLEPDGSVTWRVIRDLVRSDEDSLRKRYDEEADFLASVDGGEESWSQSFGELGAEETRVRLIRVERPYTVMVEARFASMRDLWTEILAETDGGGEVRFEADGDLRELAMRINLEPDGEKAEADDDGSLDHLRLVLTEGRFVDSQGFELSGDATVAVPLVPEDSSAPVHYVLVWDVEG